MDKSLLDHTRQSQTLEALRRTEEQLAAFNVHWSPQDGRTA